MPETVLKVRRYKAGYEVRDIEISGDMADEGKSFVIPTAFTPDGHYIGTSRIAHRLVVKRGIKPELAHPSNKVCSIGFCEREQKWYGWSHRAMYGYGVGDVLPEGSCATKSGWIDEYLAEHPEEDTSLPVGFTAHTLDDAKRMAVAFADSVA